MAGAVADLLSLLANDKAHSPLIWKSFSGTGPSEELPFRVPLAGV